MYIYCPALLGLTHLSPTVHSPPKLHAKAVYYMHMYRSVIFPGTITPTQPQVMKLCIAHKVWPPMAWSNSHPWYEAIWRARGMVTYAVCFPSTCTFLDLYIYELGVGTK